MERMLNQLRKGLILLICTLPLWGRAQQTITLRSAIDTTLKNSFDIQIATNNLAINKTNNTYGNAGGLPALNATATDNQSVTKVLQKLNSGVEIQKNNTAGNNLTSNLTAGIVLFNGFKIVATKTRLENLQKQSELQLNMTIQNSLASVMSKYFDVVRQQEYLKIIKTSLGVSQKKLEIVSDRKKVGMANDADYLQALIDLNTVQQGLKTQELIVEQTKTELLQLMGTRNFYPYTIEDSIQLDRTLQLNTILSYLQKNPQYQAAGMQVKINEQVVKEISALRFPTLRLNTGVNFNRNQSAAGLTLMNQSLGPFAGLTLTLPIYNGNAYKIQKEAAVYNTQNAQLQQESLLTLLTASAVKTYQSYSTTLQQLQSQESSIEFSGRLINVVMERFRVNQATILDVKAAQASYETTGYQLVNLKYAAKVAEIELKRLIFQLAN